MNKDGLDLLKDYEKFRGKAYKPTPHDVWTIGWGFTKGVKEGDTMTLAQANARLKKEVQEYEDAVARACTRAPNENELAAMTCFAFNVGKEGFKGSTVLKAHNKGDSQAAARAFGLWNKQKGVVLAGLTRRRSEEAALYLKPTPEQQNDYAMPQTVDPETSLTKSPIGLAGGVTSVTGALGVISSVGGQANDAAGTVGGAVSTIKTAREWATNAAAAIGLTPIEIFCIALVAIGGVVMVYRYLQRKNGWV